jgi:hypothetical protein
MSTQKIEVLFPIGRLVAGSLTKPQDKDAEGRPLTIKSGPSAGQPRVDYFFAVAIPKTGEQSWAQTEWGQKIYAEGLRCWPQGQYNSPQFAWKVKDGDSQIPNLKGKKPCDNEGWPGHWIVFFSSGFAPKTFDAKGTSTVDAAAIKLGHYVQVFGTVGSNESTQKPGMFINHGMVAHSGFGPEITVGPDASAVGFGNQALPAGASSVPVTTMTPPAGGAPLPGAPLPGAPAGGAAPLPGAPVTPAAPVTPTPVAPNPAILAAPAAPGAPAAPAAPPAKVMTAAANGVPYESYIANGWTDAQLIQHGLLAA